MMRLVMLMAVVVAATAGCFGEPVEDLTGRLTLTEGWEPVGSASCEGAGGYADVGVGMDVTVYDGTGAIVGAGATTGAVVAHDGCRFTFTVRDVPAARDFYRIDMGRRGEFTYSGAELDALDWTVEYSLGN